MINLIPNEEKKKMIRDFYLRLMAVFFMMLGFSTLVATASLLPAYFAAKAKKNLAVAELVRLEKEPIPELDQEAMASVDELKKKLVLIETAEKEKFELSARIIDEILTEKMSDIKINSIHYEIDPSNGRKITVAGVAPSRERLLIFRQALEQNKAFTRVDLPISNFIKGADITFFLTLYSS